MNQSLQILLNAKSRKSSLSYIQLVIYLERYIAVNFQFISNILIINKEFVSFVLMIAIVTMLGLNVHSVAMMALRRLPLMESLFLLIICVLQTFFSALAMQPMVEAVGAVHSSKKYLYRAQPYLDGTSVQMKLKLAIHYEVVNGGEKFTFTVGPLGKITTEAFFQQLSFRKVPRVLRLIITSLLSISADYVTALADTKKVSLLTLPIGTLLYYLYLLFCFLRLIIAIFVLNWNLLPDYLHYDARA
ncbi:hypothetical protein TYRP_016757 [Tyrophagus putrescentiae]|nr:hypothetical protein TYRP_016757 [Tyrophagus putrescentiae]